MTGRKQPPQILLVQTSKIIFSWIFVLCSKYCFLLYFQWWLSYISANIWYLSFWDCHFTEHNGPQLGPFGSKQKNFILFTSWTVLHKIDVPQFLCSVLLQRVSRLFLCFCNSWFCCFLMCMYQFIPQERDCWVLW